MIFVTLICLFLFSVFLSLSMGAFSGWNSEVFWLLRVPRTLCGIGVGGGIAVAGALIQASLGNPLADPFVLGISSAAVLGATIGIVFFYSTLSPGIFAFVFAVLSLFIINFWLKTRIRNTTDILLTGVVAGLFFHACTLLILALSNPAMWTENLNWVLGSIANKTNSESLAVLLLVLIISFLGWLHWKPLDLLCVDELTAQSSGVDIVVYRKRIFVLVALLTAVCVSFTGVIGFIGLLVPHMLRKLRFTSYRKLLPLTFLGGATLLLFSDVLARVVAKPLELPVGVILSLLGAPLFLVFIYRE